MFRLTFIEKSSCFHQEYRLIRLLFAYSIFKNIEILSGQGCVQIKPNSAWSITSVIRMWNKKNFWYSLPRKKVSISNETFWISQKRNFKNRSFSSGQGVVQIKPNSAWSITSVIRMKTKRIFGVACLGKKLVFHTELFEFLEKGILKTGLFYRVKKLFKSNQTWYGVSPG